MKHQENIWNRLAFYLNPNDGRYEDLAKGNRARNIFKDYGATLWFHDRSGFSHCDLCGCVSLAA